MTTASAPGKVILAGEHAVVYGRPAIAAPVWQTTATATVVDGPPGSGCHIWAPQIHLHSRLAIARDDEPLAMVTRLVLQELDWSGEPDWRIDVQSTIPIASGMGSGAAISTALVRSLFAHAGRQVTPETVSRLVFESERFYHGTPSGIDNTVVAYGKPIWFVKGQPPQVFTPGAPFTLAIADTGIAVPTKETVSDVRRVWSADPERCEARFDAIGEIVHAVRRGLELGDLVAVGLLFDRNHALLAQLGVSSPALEHLVNAARGAGALGAKLSGGGRGGNVIALVEADSASRVERALLAARAKRVIVTEIG